LTSKAGSAVLKEGSNKIVARTDIRTRDAEEIAHLLRARIQNSELLPGEWLREARLCSEFKVGRSTVRRALRELADDGLINLHVNRGAQVTATTVDEVFDLYEVRAALYGLAVRFACHRAKDADIQHIITGIDKLLDEATSGASAEQIIATSEANFTEMAAFASSDAQRMIESVRRKTRFHFSYVALAINTSPRARPYAHWRRVRAALLERDADKASQAARDILYFMQGEVARLMLARGSRIREDAQLATDDSRKKGRGKAERK
jgi:DNA-binding GntR family transcriptional regulator